jgi:exoribonuclease II
MITREGLDGYLKVKLMVNDKQKDFFIHRLVAEYFLEKEEGKNYVNHKDGVKTHSYLSNLEWCTAKENVEHAHSMYKRRIMYTEEQRNTIAEMLKSGMQVQVIAKTAGFFVTNGYVRKIRKELKLEAQRSTTIPKGSRA